MIINRSKQQISCGIRAFLSLQMCRAAKPIPLCSSFMWNSRAAPGTGKAHLAGVTWRKSGCCAERQGLPPTCGESSKKPDIPQQVRLLAWRCASHYALSRAGTRVLAKLCQVNGKVRYDNIILMFPKKIWLPLKCIKSNRLLRGKVVAGKHAVVDFSALTMVKISSSQFVRNLQCFYTRGGVFQLILLSRVTRQWQQQMKDIC